ncbi:MAG: hypothetical protein IJV00_07390, partial [Clostridia bacterium]|nr:hypothetical protein [Clostridia bacterium]
MSALFLPVFPDSFESESLHFAFNAQKDFCWGEKKVFGVSESGFFEFDNELNYQYKAMGVPALRLKRENDDTLVISPYSSFIMLREAPNTVMKNLASLKRLGMYGKYGFYEALDCSRGRTGGCAVVKSYMAHHVGMSLIAGANLLLDDVFVKRFCADENVRASLILLEEKIPVDAPVPDRKLYVRESKTPLKPRDVKERSHVRGEERFFVYGGCGLGVVCSSKGTAQLAVRTDKEPLIFSRPLSVNGESGLTVRVNAAGKEFSTLKSENPDGSVYSFYDCSGCCQIVVRHKKTLVRFTILPVTVENAAIGLKIEVKGAIGEVGVCIECFPVLCDKKTYSAHPAFRDLFEEFYSTDGASLIISRRLGQSKGVYAAFSFSGEEKTFSACGEPQDTQYFKPLGTLASSGKRFSLLYPHSLLMQKKTVGYAEKSVSFEFSVAISADEKDAAGVSEKVAAKLKDRRSFSELVTRANKTAGRFDAMPTSDFENRVLKKWLFYDDRRFADNLISAAKEELWALGVSGDLPIVTVLPDEFDSQKLQDAVRRKKLHHLCGINYDLVFPVADDGYRHEKLDDLSRVVFKEKTGYLL